MKTYTITYGWAPPQIDRWRGTFRLFYNTEEKTEIREHKDFETGEIISEEVTYWLCDVIEFDKDSDTVRMIREGQNSLECQKHLLLLKIEAYDSSEKVNSFSIGGYDTWLDKATRVGLKLRFEAEQRMGKTETILWQDGVSFPLTISDALLMLDSLELYASNCYDTTQMHIANAKKLESVEDIKNYDHRSGYPEKIRL